MAQAIHKKYNLPSSIKVFLKKSKKGFIVVLPEYSGAISYVENLNELVDVVNDLILTYFQVPRKEAIKANFIYLPPVKASKSPSKQKAISGVIDRFVSFTPKFSYA
ncbi:hypothetical protein COT64_03620 [Candidatus Shapirobacteria bacterium CG09_land_8_20_14_0_10_39_12]|uniref:Uncharacterized protein n=1 Tax=Candidatus Shapirobacteria bacterium CG09_land_8_20_14_0_10_39_12 TaxID=1974885 RepID=A0A2H0WNM4_9BACT|nr:MAG: hypothetical protein COT64_03620 [Candidatus Shapirobacteria bacterium CG09_land_8_20_14_0_10_39_12]